MAADKINNSINADIKIDQLIESLTAFADKVVFTTSNGSSVMRSAASVLINNVELSHTADNFASVEKIFERSQDLVIRGKKAKEKLGPAPSFRDAGAEDVKKGYARSLGTYPQDTLDLLWKVTFKGPSEEKPGETIKVANEASVLKPGSINQLLLERFLYRGELYYSLYKSAAPELEALSIEDPYQVDDPQYAEKMYTTDQKLEITSWLLGNLDNSDEDLRALVFQTADSNISLEKKNIRNNLLNNKIEYYIIQLLELKSVIHELDHKEAYLNLINNHIKELES